jgi:hypothetical protein
VDPVFVPRPLLRVPQLPRNANGKLPQVSLVKLFVQTQRTAESAVAAQQTSASPPDGARESPIAIPMSHPAIAGHFPGNPIIPGVVILTQVVDAIKQQLPDIVLGKLLSMRFHAPLRPDEAFTVHAEMRGAENRLAHIEVRREVDQPASGTLIAAGQWAVVAGDPAGSVA